MKRMRPNLPLNALRAFSASARHLSFPRAGLELFVSQAAISHQIKGLEARLGVVLFRRLPRGLALTDEGAALVPVLSEAFERIGGTLERFADGRFQEVLTIGVVGTFAAGWLLPRLPAFAALHPEVDLRLLTNNNRVDLAGETLVRPFEPTLRAGSYWLTRLHSRPETAAMRAFRQWLVEAAS